MSVKYVAAAGSLEPAVHRLQFSLFPNPTPNHHSLLSADSRRSVCQLPQELDVG